MSNEISEIEDLKETYNKISSSYQTKKSDIWHELRSELGELYTKKSGILLDAGCGNGRNLKGIDRTLNIGLDFSIELLYNFIDPENAQRVLASVTHLPFRSSCINETISIAVIHHLPNYTKREVSIKEFYRTLIVPGLCVLTVWRKWRSGLHEKLLKKIRGNEPIEELVDHRRPWKDSNGVILGYRYYHYYTWKELYFQVVKNKFVIAKRKIMGGRHNDENFLVELQKHT